MVESIDFGEDSNKNLQSMITQTIFTEDLKQKIDAVIAIIYAMDEQTYEETEAEKFKKYLQEIVSDKEFMRRLQNVLIMKSNVEMAMEYTGFDYLSNPEFNYDYEMEQSIQKIATQINIFLGKTLKYMQSDEGIEL